MELFSNWKERSVTHLDVTDRRLFYGKHIMLAHNTVHPHAAIPKHHHPHEQLLYVVSGACDITTDGQTKHVETGGLAWFPANSEHYILNTDDTPLIAIDIFYPIREDFIEAEKKGI